MKLTDFHQFSLVGGTALALQIGHRISIDLDLFTYQDYDQQNIWRVIETMGDAERIVDKPPFLQVRLNDVKVDFLKFPYPFVQEYTTIDGIRMAPIKLIAVMKLLAIARRGVKKDFYDLYFILKQYHIHEVVNYFSHLLPNVDLFHILKSLTYFEDAESDAEPKMLEKVSWKDVKIGISDVTHHYLNHH